jgi:hypothetical protein
VSGIAIDRDHVRLGEPEGEPLFDDAHEPGKPVRAIQRTRDVIHAGLERTKSLIEELAMSKLLDERHLARGSKTASASRCRVSTT